MKQPKKLTRFHKEYLHKRNIDPDLWMLQFEDKDKYVYVNKLNGNTMVREKQPSRN